jgi:hypothetical protein
MPENNTSPTPSAAVPEFPAYDQEETHASPETQEAAEPVQEGPSKAELAESMKRIIEAASHASRALQELERSETSDNNWATFTPEEGKEEVDEFGYTYDLTMFEPGGVSVQQVPMTRKEFIELKEHFARRRGLDDDSGQYSDNGSMPLSKALGILHDASHSHIREVAAAVQGITSGCRASTRPQSTPRWPACKSSGASFCSSTRGRLTRTACG